MALVVGRDPWWRQVLVVGEQSVAVFVREGKILGNGDIVCSEVLGCVVGRLSCLHDGVLDGGCGLSVHVHGDFTHAGA